MEEWMNAWLCLFLVSEELSGRKKQAPCFPLPPSLSSLSLGRRFSFSFFPFFERTKRISSSFFLFIFPFHHIIIIEEEQGSRGWPKPSFLSNITTLHIQTEKHNKFLFGEVKLRPSPCVWAIGLRIIISSQEEGSNHLYVRDVILLHPLPAPCPTSLMASLPSRLSFFLSSDDPSAQLLSCCSHGEDASLEEGS